VPLVVSTLAIAVTLSYARGGRLRRVADVPLRLSWLLFAGVALQLAVDLAAGRELLADAGPGGYTLLLVSQLLVVGWVAANWHLPGIFLVTAGLLLNAIVIGANGAMPVSPAAMDALGLGPLEVPPGKHTLMTEATVLPWLADVIPVPPLRTIISVGDVVLALGLVPLTHALMTYRTTAERRGRDPQLSSAPVPSADRPGSAPASTRPRRRDLRRRGRGER
jgi:hypothetical protein